MTNGDTMRKDTRNAAGFALTVTLLATLLGTGCNTRKLDTLAAQSQDSTAACIEFFQAFAPCDDGTEDCQLAYCSKFGGR